MRRLLAVLARLRAEIGADEVCVLIGVGCLAYGLSLVWSPAPWIACGLLALYYGLPSRKPFIQAPKQDTGRHP